MELTHMRVKEYFEERYPFDSARDRLGAIVYSYRIRKPFPHMGENPKPAPPDGRSREGIVKRACARPIDIGAEHLYLIRGEVMICLDISGCPNF